MNKVILASASPRRKELLMQIGLDFDVCVSTCEERITKTDPAEVVCELSAQKALDVWQKIKDKKEIVIGADTVVAYDGKILGKPGSGKEAVTMLTALSGHTHEVYTGVTFCYEEDGVEKQHTFYEKTAVTFYPMSQEEIESYVASGEPMDKAGAYGIQGSFAAYVKGIEGDYNNVVGLPVGRLYQEIKELLCR
ncbi:MAG: Maf family protein [Lachnospiraceae bacterium]